VATADDDDVTAIVGRLRPSVHGEVFVRDRPRRQRPLHFRTNGFSGIATITTSPMFHVKHSI
jgi:hypothetical protein